MGIHERFSHEQAWRRGPGIAEGADLERALFGKAQIDAGQQEAGYLSFRDAITYAKEHQPSIFKRSPEVQSLRQQVALLCKDEDTPVKFYTVVGTPLDIYHGVDAFFEQGSRIATVDVSMRAKEDYKADVLLTASLDEEGAIELPPHNIAEVAAQIAQKLNNIH